MAAMAAAAKESVWQKNQRNRNGIIMA